jgi:phosphopantothenoylcysteine synthetase/decarboxylase
MEPDEGTMACGEYGQGRLPHVDAIFAAALAQLEHAPLP